MSKLTLIEVEDHYISQAQDTSKEIDIFQFKKWQEMPIIKKAQLIIGNTQGCRQLSLMGIKNQFPHFTLQQQRELYIKKILGEKYVKILEKFNLTKEIMIGNPIELALLIAKILDDLAIPYFIGGSFASSLWGESRATLDIDVIADLKLNQIDNFIKQVQALFYVSENDLKQAIENQSSFNLIHFDTNEKIDLFILKKSPLSLSEMTRKTRQKVTEGQDYLYLSTPEDTILKKLIWYRESNYLSERQWRDILGVLKNQGDRLDFAYLNHWCQEENLTNLLDQALKESGLSHQQVRQKI